MKISKLVTTLALAGVATLAVAPQIAIAQAAPMKPADLKATADAIFNAAYSADAPGAAVVVTRGGRVVYESARGLADVEARRLITPDTPFPLGSIVKQITAATVLKLVEEGRISLDDPISRFFPDWPQPAAKSTARQLLNHTSGVEDYTKIPGWVANNRTRSFTTQELLDLIRSLPAKTEPGTAWEYNNAGYVLLGAIVEKASGQRWHEAVAARVTAPLGLATIAPPGPAANATAVARGYRREGGRIEPVPPTHPSMAFSAGGLVGSARDLARFSNALHGGRLVSPTLYKEMTSPARLADGSTRPYGFGFRLQQLLDRQVIVHGGAGAGLDTDAVYIPSEDIYVAVLANTEDAGMDASTVTRRLAAAALGTPFPMFSRAEVDMRAIEPLFGLYKAVNGPALRFFSRDGKLYVGEGDRETEAFAAGGDRFFFGPDDLKWIRLVRKQDGAHLLEAHFPNRAKAATAVRSGPVPPPFALPQELLRSYAGKYQTETLAVSVQLGADGHLTITPAGQNPLPLRPVSKTEFRIDGTPMRLEFHPENGKVDRFTLYRGARELHGKRVP
ncbi:MAG TPA: serine hydrolase domain-containing protein [Sphingomicrobium sp.]|nr:serine hydrolase domain-containing protein [Sphingomicrobium sp.]